MSLHSYFINLDAAIERRQLLESNYQELMPLDWPLKRIRAVDRTVIERHKPAGALSTTEKACFFSHIQALETSLGNDAHAFILEDDAYFGAYSSQLIENSLNSLGDGSWDILYADLGLTNPANMVEFFMARKELCTFSSRAWKTLKIENIAYVGATAYIVNRHSKSRLYQFLKEQTRFDIPFDLLLRNLVWTEQVRAYMIFPFATSLSPLADVSQIQLKQTEVIELVWNAYRRLMWFENEEYGLSELPNLSLLKQGVADTRSSVMGDIIALTLAEKFGKK